MWLLITFVILWAITPGPVFIMIIQEARKRGSAAGISISAGAAVTSILMVVSALFIHSSGLSAVLNSPKMSFIEQAGAIGIILMGLFTVYKSIGIKKGSVDFKNDQSSTGGSFMQGMGLMIANIPQALLFFNIIVPQTVAPEALAGTIVALGSLKIVVTFGCHSVAALISGRAQPLFNSTRFKAVFDVSMATLVVGMGVNILF